MDWWWDLLKAMDAHEGQAAWAQGFFSVVAIIAAILIDQGATRRERRERLEAERVARAARIRCIESCAGSLEVAAGQMERADLQTMPNAVLSPDVRRAIDGARELVAAYQASRWEADPRLLVGLTFTARIMDEAQVYIQRIGLVFLRQQPEFVAKLREFAEEIRDLRRKLDTAEV